MKYNQPIFRILLLLILSTSWGNVFAQKKKPISEDQRIKFESFYLNGAREKIANNVDEAIKQFRASLLIDPASDASYYNLAELYLQKKMMQDAKQNVQKAIDLNADNLWYRKLLCAINEATGNFKEAADVAIYISKYETPALNLMQASGYYEQDHDYAKAIKMLEKAEKFTGLNEEIILRKEQLFLALNKFEKAAKEVKRLCEAYPDNMRYQVMLAELYLVNNHTKEGVALYKNILTKDPKNGYASFAMADYYRIQGDSERFFESMKVGMASSDVDVKSKLRMMVLFMTSKSFTDNFQRSQILADIFIATHPSEPTVFLVKGDLYIEQQNFAEAHRSFEKAVALDASMMVAFQQMIFCANKLSDTRLLQKDCAMAIENFPDETSFHLYLTFANLQLKEYDKAVASALRGIEVAGDEKEALSQLYVSLGDAYHYLKNMNGCDSAFEKALELDSSNAYALNNYAYFLSLRKIKLDRAEYMSRRSLEINPDNASYADTYGWILFQMKEYSKAEKYISKSLELEPGNTEVMDHLGDVLFKLNKTQEAIAQWKKAKEMGRTDDLLEKKIKDGKWYE